MNATAFASLYASTLPPTAVVSVTTAAVSRSAYSASRHAEKPSIVTAITLPRILNWIRMFSLRMIWPPDSGLGSGREGLLQELWNCSGNRAEPPAGYTPALRFALSSLGARRRTHSPVPVRSRRRGPTRALRRRRAQSRAPDPHPPADSAAPAKSARTAAGDLRGGCPRPCPIPRTRPLRLPIASHEP